MTFDASNLLTVSYCGGSFHLVAMLSFWICYHNFLDANSFPIITIIIIIITIIIIVVIIIYIFSYLDVCFPWIEFYPFNVLYKHFISNSTH